MSSCGVHGKRTNVSFVSISRKEGGELHSRAQRRRNSLFSMAPSLCLEALFFLFLLFNGFIPLLGRFSMASSPCLEDRRWAMFLPRGLLRPLGTPPVTPGTQNLYLFARKQRLLSELFFYIIIKPKLPLQLNGRLYDHIGKSWSLFSTKPGKVQS